MNRYTQALLLALLVVLASVSLRRVTAAALGSEWQPSFSNSGTTLSPVPPPHATGPEVAVGGSPVPPPHVAVGGSPVPPPHVAVGGSPVPPPHVAVGGSPVPPPHVAVGGSPVPPPHGA
jgi:hypothetical protein